jgi:enoyl-CoA hydratase
MQANNRILATAPAAGIAVLSFSNPPHGYFDDAGERELLAQLDRIEADDSVRVVVLTGADEGVFVRHYDVGVLEERARAMAARGLRFSTERPVPEAGIHRSLRRIERSSRVFIAAINGVAMGGGYEIALACDLRLAQAGDYTLGLPEVNIGILPGAGGTQRLSRLIGQARALELILMGQVVGPVDAARLGMVNACVPGPVLPEALRWATRLAAQSPLALAHVKRLVRQAHETPIDQGLADERTLFCELMVSPEGIARMHAMNQGQMTITGVATGAPSAPV